MDAIACETSADCAGLRCIDQVCRDPRAPWQPQATLGHHMMFGTGQGYGLLIALLDIAAAGVEPLLLFEAGSHNGSASTGFGISCFVTVGLVGSTTHFAHARVIPGIVSLFAWTSAAGLTFVFGGLAGLGNSLSGHFDDGAAWAAGLTFGTIAAATLTMLDVWMARPMKTKRASSSFTVAPSFAPVRDGVVGSLAGTF